MISDHMQDYLKAICQLGAGGAEVSTSAIAEKLDVSPASVTNMLKKLAELRLVRHLPYQGVELTASGRKVSLGGCRAGPRYLREREKIEKDTRMATSITPPAEPEVRAGDVGTVSSAMEVLEGRGTKGRLARLLPFLGPAFIACVAYVD